jgi:hypothetical protein
MVFKKLTANNDTRALLACSAGAGGASADGNINAEAIAKQRKYRMVRMTIFRIRTAMFFAFISFSN